MKPHTKADKERFDKLHRLGCIVCRKKGTYSQPAIHHITRGGQKRDHQRTIPLCPYHHQYGGFGEAVHDRYKIFPDRYGTEDELLLMVNKTLTQTNKL